MLHIVPHQDMRRHNAEHFGEDSDVSGFNDLTRGLINGDSSSDDEPDDRRPVLNSSSGSDSDANLCGAFGDAQRSSTVDSGCAWESMSLFRTMFGGS